MEAPVQIGLECGKTQVGGPAVRAYDDIAALEADESVTQQVAQPSLDPVADDGRADRAAYDESDPRGPPGLVGARVAMKQVDHHAGRTSPRTTSHDGVEVGGPGEPMSSRQHGNER